MSTPAGLAIAGGLAAAALLVTSLPSAAWRPDHGVAGVETPPVRPKPLQPEQEADDGDEEEPGPASPTEEQLAAARAFADERRGLVSFAVVDTDGNLHCHRCRERHSTASVVKAMLLVAYLQRAAREGAELSARERRLLSAMVTRSDNPAADAIHRRLGDAPVERLAARSDMEGFGIRGYWGNAVTTALDQARLFARLDELTPEAHRPYARELLSSIAPEQSWGLAETARPEWQAFFKGGWTPSRRGHLAHQVGRLERDGEWMAVAILTDGNPSHAYGVRTVRGIARALLR